MFRTVDDLTSAVTAVAGPDGPLATLAQTLTDALDSVWAAFFGAAVPPGATNWNAYSHEELYQMLWQDADVGDVGTVAAEWGRHSTALTGFAEALRGQGAELRSNWQGRAAELAAERLAELSDRIWNAGARASTVQKAAADASDALALARNSMPPPPENPMTLMTSAVGAGPVPPLEAVLVGGTRLFTADAVAGAAKAEAVRVMQRYEAALLQSSQQVVPAQPGATTSRTYRVDGVGGADGAPTTAATAAGGSATGGTPWSRLVGGGQPGPGGLVGSGPVGGQHVAPVPGGVVPGAAAARGMGPGGYFGPGMAPRAGDEEHDKAHRNALPNVDSGIFATDQRTSNPVIGMDREPDDDF